VNAVALNLALAAAAGLLFLALHALLVACEISLVKLRYGEVDEAAVNELKRKRAIARLIDKSAQTGRVVRFSKTLCTVALGLVLLPLIGDLLSLVFPRSADPAGRWLVALAAFFVAVVAHFFIAELFPRGLAIQDPVRALRRCYGAVVFFRILTLPSMLLFRKMKKGFFGWLGVDEKDELNPLDVDVQLRAMGEESNSLSPVVRKIVNRTLQIQQLVVQDILLPRNQVVICDLDEPMEKNLEAMKRAGHTRFPICRGDLDRCVGILHIKDLFRRGRDGSGSDPMKLKRQIAVFPLETTVEEALERMLRAKFHMALVVDEFGGTVGIVTMESILEELVGDIQDEFDTEEDQIVSLEASDAFRISGLAPVHDVEEQLAIEIENQEVSTFGGLITGELGRIPDKGERLSLGPLEVTVDEVDERRVIAASVTRRPDQRGAEGAE